MEHELSSAPFFFCKFSSKLLEENENLGGFLLCVGIPGAKALLDLCSSGNVCVVLRAWLIFTDPKPGARVHFLSFAARKTPGKCGCPGKAGLAGV